ncbi:hypothetical protein B566_EDAN008938, partial [Ephemera danica]
MNVLYGSAIKWTMLQLDEMMRWLGFLVVLTAGLTLAQQNRAPHFVPGGDMHRLALPEDTPVGAAVYTLRGEDPEGGRLHYSISGQAFSVHRETGVVTLVRPLDREKQDTLEVIISVTDDAPPGYEPNTVSLRREIPVLDRNDNAPQFVGRPYSFTVAETARVGAVVYTGIAVTDADAGVNGEVTLDCDRVASTPAEACDTFVVNLIERSLFPTAGRNYSAEVRLARALDFERRSAYSLVLVAHDNALDRGQRLSATANVAVHVQDVQDQPPAFLNAPYSATVPEASPEGTSILTIRTRDGDTGEPRKVKLRLEGDLGGHFRLEVQEGDGPEVTATLVTSDVPLDREHPQILQSGGIYTFNVVATEMAGPNLDGDSASAQIMIVITDVDDQLPTFNQNMVTLNVSEDIAKDTPLPGLHLVSDDRDVGENARYRLELRGPSARAFTVQPREAEGRTPILLRVTDPSQLDYDLPTGAPEAIEFDVVAVVTRDGVDVDATKAHVTLNVFDANDHAPSFQKSNYKIRVPENLKPGSLLQDIQAKDPDSGEYGKVTYFLQGFGVERFSTDSEKGGLYLAKSCPPSGCVDYESQRSFSLTLSARDGGGKIATVNLVIEVDDVNDNAPKFDQVEYRRTVREGATSFDPQLFVRATDIDGPTQGNGGITYSINNSNAPEGTFLIDPDTGELRLNRPAAAGETPFGQYELKVRASDHGTPTAHTETSVVIRVGVPGNQQPVFLGGPLFEARIPENAAVGDSVIKLLATDPDGRDSDVMYRIVAGAKDNFVVNETSGQIVVAAGGLQSRERDEDYKILVAAVDSGKPYRATATATVQVHVTDVNNQPPKFARDAYEKHVSERVSPNEVVLTVTAEDPDMDAKLQYTILEPATIKDKTGVEVKLANFKNYFKINATSGEISVAHELDHQTAAVITFTVEVKDLKALENIEEQVARAEVTVYVESYSDDNPVFPVPWTPAHPTIPVSLGERRTAGTQLLKLTARDPLRDGAPISRFQIAEDEQHVARLDQYSGELTLSRDLPYEASNMERSSEVTVIIHMEDVNHYTPQFSEKTYKSRVAESARHPATVLTVNATDRDGPGPSGYGDVRYSLSGAAAHLFAIEPESGLIRVAPGVTLDRETQSVLTFNVVAADTPQGGALQKKSTAEVIVDVLDVNDNAPRFTRPAYSAVVPENVAVGWNVVRVSARDPDEADSGKIEYEIADEGEATGMFSLDSQNGELRTARLLTGKGRTRPYRLVMRAQDLGQPPRSTDVPLDVYIGDVATNDGVPVFLRPLANETAHVAENSTLGSPVFQVVASDPDDPNTMNGRLTYKFLDNGKFGTDNLAFNIDPETGLISTRQALDRERQAEYTLVVVVRDEGNPPQQASSVLKVQVTDVDDHKPMFLRTQQDDAVPMRIQEESPIGTEVGHVKATDEDIAENGMIDYLITYGNEDGLFNITRDAENRGIIRVAKRVDREAAAEHLLTIKCYPDPSEIQVRVTVEDIDDNLPRFKEDNTTVGVRLNVPVDTALVTLEAMDADADAPEVTYSLLSAEFMRPGSAEMNVPADTPIFSLHERTGELRTAASLAPFAEGMFTLVIAANNSEDESRVSNTTVK